MTGQANPAEALASRTLALTWVFYLLGALYIVGPALGWILAALGALALYLGPAMRPDLRAAGPVPPIVWGWIAGMSALLVVLWIGHVNWRLGLGATIKSSIGWAKGWALLAVFPFAGAVLPIRREAIVRAHGHLALGTLILLPTFLAAPFVGAPALLFTSPLKAVGGPGPEYFSVFLYTIDPGNGAARWQFYAPWSPFAGMLGVFLALFAREETRRFWRWVGFAAALAMILASKSRMSLVALPVCLLLPSLAPLLLRSWAWGFAAAAMAGIAVVSGALVDAARRAVEAFRGARADSTRVRETLQRIAEERWRGEAPWFGHGAVERGPHIVEYMPIGSHHTWYGLLFVKGLVGVVALALPTIWQFALAFLDAVRGARGRLPLGIALALTILSLGENIEIEAYLIWPALLTLGVHAREMRADPLQEACVTVRASGASA